MIEKNFRLRRIACGPCGEGGSMGHRTTCKKVCMHGIVAECVHWQYRKTLLLDAGL